MSRCLGFLIDRKGQKAGQQGGHTPLATASQPHVSISPCLQHPSCSSSEPLPNASSPLSTPVTPLTALTPSPTTAVSPLPPSTPSPPPPTHTDPNNDLYTALGLIKGVGATFLSVETPLAIKRRMDSGNTADLMDILPRWQPWMPPKNEQVGLEVEVTVEGQIAQGSWVGGLGLSRRRQRAWRECGVVGGAAADDGRGCGGWEGGHQSAEPRRALHRESAQRLILPPQTHTPASTGPAAGRHVPV